MLIRLHEAESKMSTLQSEKETAEEQVEIIIVVGGDEKSERQFSVPVHH